MLKSFKSSTILTNAKNTFNPPPSSSTVMIAGKDISQWLLVQVDNIPPGPLGILLDGTVPDAAVIDTFAPVNVEGTKGPIESHGAIQSGSVLVSVNEYDLIALKYSLQEVGRVLRETNGVVRTMGFKIPPPSITRLPPSDQSETDMRGLIKGVTNSTPSSPLTKSWTLKGLLSPSHQNNPESPTGVESTNSASLKPAFSTPAADSQDNVRAATPTQPPSPKRQVIGPRRASMVMGKTVIAMDETYTVMAPAGPLGLNLDGDQPDRAVVIGYLPVPDGSKGVLEQGNLVPKGSILIHINGFDVSNVSLEDVRNRLRALAGLPRELVFIMPPTEIATSSPTAQELRTSFIQLDDASKRRKLELALILKHDQPKITRKECWFLISTAWMTRWVLYTSKDGPPPGPIDNSMLLEPNWEERLRGNVPGRPDATRTGLVVMKDYRGVTPIVWSLLADLHGTANMPPLARYTLDVNADPVVATELENFLKAPRPQAHTLIMELRERCPTAFM